MKKLGLKVLLVLIFLADGSFADQNQQALKYKKQLNWGKPLEYGRRWAIELKPFKPTDHLMTYWPDFRLPIIMVCQSGVRCLSGNDQPVNPLTGTVLGY